MGARRDELREALDAAFPRAWREVLERRVPFYRALTEPEQERLEDQIQLFVLTKRFAPVRRLEITDEMKVVVAAAACRLTLTCRGSTTRTSRTCPCEPIGRGDMKVAR